MPLHLQSEIKNNLTSIFLLKFCFAWFMKLDDGLSELLNIKQTQNEKHIKTHRMSSNGHQAVFQHNSPIYDEYQTQ